MKKIWLVIGASVLTSSLMGELSYDLTHVTDKRSLVPVLVIGGGPAGLAAAVYCARDGYQTSVVKGPLPGGQITETGDVENCPGVKKTPGSEIMDVQYQQAEAAGVKFLSGSVTALDLGKWPFSVTLDDGSVLRACAVIIATGAQAKTLNIPGERDYWGRGVSICAVCDAWAFKNKNVVIIGGGDSAVEQALQLSLHAAHVTILARGTVLRASDTLQKRLAHVPTISVEYQKEVRKILGNGQEVTGIIVRDTRFKPARPEPLSVHPDASPAKFEERSLGRSRRVVEGCSTTQRAIDGVFLAIGHTPRSELVAGQLDRDEHGCIKVSGRSQVVLRAGKPVPGVCAAGEVADPDYRQLAVAFGDGSRAGKDTQKFLYGIGLTPQEIRTW